VSIPTVAVALYVGAAIITYSTALLAGGHPLPNFAPAPLLPNELMNRKRVEKLIGDEEKRCVVRHIAHPLHLGARKCLRLDLSQNRTGFNQADLRRGKEIGPDFGGAQHIRHQRAAPGPELHQIKPIGPATILPSLHEK